MDEGILRFSFLTNRFARDAFKLMVGTAMAQAITVAASPALTRIYSPEFFGTLVWFSSVSAFASIISTGRYELAVVLPKEDSHAVNIMAVAFLILGCITALSLLIVFSFHSLLIQLLGRSGIEKWLYLIPCFVLLTGAYNTMNFWCNRKKHYTMIAVAQIAQSLVMVSTYLLMGMQGFISSGLITGLFVGQITAVIVLGWAVWRDTTLLRREINLSLMLENAKRYDSFPRINSLHAFVDTIQTSGVVFVISYFWGNTILGYYAMTQRVLRTPSGLIGSAVAQVFFRQASELHNTNGDVHAVAKRITLKIALYSLPVFVLLLLWGGDIFVFAFGNKWSEAGTFVQILSPWFFCNFIATPIIFLPMVLNRQKTMFKTTLVGNILIFGIIILGGAWHQDEKTVFFVLSSVMVLYFSYLILWLLRISKKEKAYAS